MKKVSCSVALLFFAECYNHTLGNMVIHIVQSIILHSISILLLSAYVGFLVPHLNLLPQGKVFKSAQAATLSNKHPQEEVWRVQSPVPVPSASCESCLRLLSHQHYCCPGVHSKSFYQKDRCVRNPSWIAAMSHIPLQRPLGSWNAAWTTIGLHVCRT